MSDASVTRRTRKFYEQFQFPGNRPIDRDGLIFMRRFARSIEARFRDLPGEKLRVLDAGCGTGNTSISLSRRFPQAEFSGLDQSQASLEKARHSARQCRLTNLHFRRWNLMRPLPYKRQFDIVLCLGVLHHTADMNRGLVNLRAALKRDGELYLWIYGRHGRYRHSLNMRLLEILLGAAPTASAAVTLAREFLINTDGGSALRDLLGRTSTDAAGKKALEDPVWIADQFLNPHETLLDMKELVELAERSGFTVAQVLGMDRAPERMLNSPLLLEKFRALSSDQQLIAADLLVKPERYFVVLRKAAAERIRRPCTR